MGCPFHTLHVVPMFAKCKSLLHAGKVVRWAKAELFHKTCLSHCD